MKVVTGSAAALFLLLFSTAFAQNTDGERATVSSSLDPEGGHIVVEARGVKPKAPLFYSASAIQVIRLEKGAVTGEAKLTLRVMQGVPEVLTLGLAGTGEVIEVTGEHLRDWAVRQGTGKTAGQRFLDLRPVLESENKGPTELQVVIHTRLAEPVVPGAVTPLLIGPGESVGFNSEVTVIPGAGIDARVTKALNLTPLDQQASPQSERKFSSLAQGELEVNLSQRGAAVTDAELVGVRLIGRLDEEAGCVAFHLTGEARGRMEKARVRLLSGRAALSDTPAGEGWHIEVAQAEGEPVYDLVFDKPGNYPIDLAFLAAVKKGGEWETLQFQMPAGAIVPLVIEGLGENVSFNPKLPVVPEKSGQTWTGFMPAAGTAEVGWKRTRDSAEGALSFTSQEQNEVRVGAGLLQQTAQIYFRILQGKLPGVRIQLDGPGEILAVEGPNVVGWKIVPEGNKRTLDIQLSRPFEKEGALTIRSQSALGSFPVRTEALRHTPEGGVRHSGYIRISNLGAVRLEIADATGMMQLAPNQFPGNVANSARQVFVYRFPSANYSYRIVADQILPEVALSQVTIYELAETDRVISAELELDIREAPLREWSLTIPSDYAVVAVSGNDVVDYVAESDEKEGSRMFKILFGKAVDGRQLIKLRLEKNQPAAAGEWKLPPLSFPGAKSVRGHIGVVSASGFRLVPAGVQKLVEMPLSYFPKQLPGLQQAFRLREPGWSAIMKIEALGQSVMADVFHLYSLKEGVVYGSVLINYFVVGAPANEWRIQIPEPVGTQDAVGNINVVGQNVRRDWRRDGNQIVVSLHQPVLGGATLLVTFEQPMSARGDLLRPGEIRPLNVQSERGFIQVVSPLQVKSEVKKAEGGLLKLEPMELPAEYRLLTASPSIATYQYTARPFELEMSINWYDQADTVDQVVDFAKLSSQISRDGQVVTDARFFVKTRGRKALRFILPEGVKLWEAKAANEIVNARADGNQTLIPLPPRSNPNEPVEVVLRLGQPSRNANRPLLQTPIMMAPTVISEWTLSGDPERLLVPMGGTAELVAPVLTETGFEWIASRVSGGMFVLFLVTVLAALLARGSGVGRKTLGFLLAGGVVLICGILALAAVESRRVNLKNLTYSATVVPQNQSVTIDVANVEAWRAMISWWGVTLGILGAILLIAAGLRVLWGSGRGGWQAPAGIALLATGLLLQHGGAALFFLAFAAGVFLFIIVPILKAWVRRRPTPPPVAASVASLILLLCAILPSTGQAESEFHEGSKSAESMLQSWKIREDRLFAEVELKIRGVVGDSFLLLKSPAILTDFVGEGVRLTKVDNGKGELSYFAVPERNGVLTARLKYELPADNLSSGIVLPTGPAAVQKVTVELDQRGWDFSSPRAIGKFPISGLDTEKSSGATLVLGLSGPPVIALFPRQRDIAAEKTQFYAEVSNLFVPGPGVVNGRFRVTIRPAQGQVAQLEMEVPKGFTVGDVGNGPVGEWRFDPVSRKLRVTISPAQSGAFKFDVETQRGTADLPVELTLEPLRVEGTAGEVGALAVAFGSDAQPENVRPTGLSAINLEDFDAALVPANREGHPLAMLQQAYRYGKEGGRLDLRVAPVAPEVRAVTKQVFSLGDDRLVLSVDLQVAITRAGLFKLSFELPEGLEVESLSGQALSHWTEAEDGGKRVATLHLNGRTIGNQSFTLTLTGTAPRPQASWLVPRFLLREATRQTGEVFLVPEKGIRLRAVGRENVSQLDARTSGDSRPGTLAFRLLQENWVLRIGIEALDAWVTLSGLEEVTVREGQTLTRLALRYRVDNAAVKNLRVRLPGLSETQAQTVRGSGSAVSDIVKVAGQPDAWDIRFQRGIAGETDVQIEYQGESARQQDKEQVQSPIFEGVRQVTLYVAVRAGGRLDVDAADIPRGWQRLDWGTVPVNLQSPGDRSVPTLCFRVAEPEGPLTINVRRHDVADALKLRVAKGQLATIFSPRGSFLTTVNLDVEVVEKSAMRVRLPKGAQLFSAFVNDESVPVVREEDAYLFNVSPNTDAERSAKVRIVYALADVPKGDIRLIGPSLSVPLENVSWRVIVPPGYDLEKYSGGLRLKESKSAGLFGLNEYVSLSSSTREWNAKKAAALIDQANVLLNQGEQEQAGEVLSRAAKANALDEASNEDARVQLRTLKTQQAVVGLNTRRQKLYFDNKSSDGKYNEQLEQAANANPFMQGKTNFNLQQMDQLLMGNTAEENSALRGIATCIVEQQLAAEPAPGAIDVTLPERGKVLTFERSVQVNGDAPLSLDLKVREARRTNGWYLFGLLLATAVAGMVMFPRRRVE